MKYRTDPHSSAKLSILGLGCMRFPGAPAHIDESKTEQLILQAVASGINYFDTAYLYPGSEEMLGKLVQRHGLRDRIYIATKLPHSGCKTPADIERLFSTSLSRLQTEYIDYYLVHNVSSFAQWESLCNAGIIQWVEEKKRSGAIRNFGFSYHGSLSDFKKVIDSYPWDFCQIQYNYANEHYQAGREGLAYAHAKGMAVIIMEPLLGGQLAKKLPKKAQACFVGDTGANPVDASVSWALRWLWNQPEVTVVLSGMGTPAQVECNAAAADASEVNSFGPQEQALFQNVLSIFHENYKIPCTGCGYCLPCAKGINIPALFSSYNMSYSNGWFNGVFNYAMSTGSHGNFPHYASDCIGCGKCTKHCPQGIEIPKQLGRVRRRLQVPMMKGIMRIATKLMS